MTTGTLRTPFGASGVLTRQFILSEEFTIAYVASIVLVTMGLPALGACNQYLNQGLLEVGCLFGIIGTGITVICSRKLITALERAHHRYHPIRN